jgi:glycosyltransferase involved in cell wall biosynthesis
MPSVCVVIINHNYAHFLAAAINSALDQSSPADDIIVVDDGSTDGSRAVIEGYGDRIVPLFKNAGGHTSALNAGYAQTRSEIVIFLDADDLLYPTCIEKVQAAWRPGDVKLQYRLNTIDADGVDQGMPFPYFPADLTPDAVRRQSLRFGVYPWTVSSGNAFSRRLLAAVLPLDEAEIYRSPDGYLSKIAPLFGDVRSLDAVLGANRVHGANAWAQTSGRMRVDAIVRGVKFDVYLHRNFLMLAKQQGVDLSVGAEPCTLHQMEYRVIAYRFSPADYPYPADNRRRLLGICLNAAAIAPNTSLMGRLAWGIWLTIILFVPTYIIEVLFRLSRGQTGRSRLSRILVKLSRGTSAGGALKT